MTLTAVQPPAAGYVSLYASSAPARDASTLNFASGAFATTTGAIVPVDGSGQNGFVAFSPVGLDLVVDVTGYFKRPGDAGGLDVLANGSRVMHWESVSNANWTNTVNTLGGSPLNTLFPGIAGATIAGGGGTLSGLPYPNRVQADQGTIAGGLANTVGPNASSGTIGGGYDNSVTNIGGTVGGGQVNTAAKWATVGGGYTNSASQINATIAGGAMNVANQVDATVGGGAANVASGMAAAIAGGDDNLASGTYAAVPGGFGNVASANSAFAAGYGARADLEGCFAWSDRSFATGAIRCAAANSVNMRALGGFFLLTGGTEAAGYTGVTLASGAGAWSTYSDRDAKAHVQPADGLAVLARLVAMPIATWNWKAQRDRVRHMGPMAQDFRAAFGLGEDETHISTVDADGVAFAAIQGLHSLLQEKEERLQEQERALASLRRDLAAIKARLGVE